MEEILIFVFQIFVEGGLQLLGWVGLDVAASRSSHREEGGCGTLTLFAVFGGVCGGLSLLVVPNPLLPNAGLRIANLFLAPLVAGSLSLLFARTLRLDEGPGQSHHFWRGFWFALVYGIVRFAYIHR